MKYILTIFLPLDLSQRRLIEQNQTAMTVYKSVKTGRKILFYYVSINETLFNRVQITDFQSVCQEKGGANSGGTSFLLKVGLVFLQ